MNSRSPRARIGWNMPRRVIDSEAYEFYLVAPRDVVLVCNHLSIRESSNIEECKAAFELVDAAVDSLISARVDIIVQLGAPVHLIGGNKGHRQLLEHLRAKSNIPVTTSSESILEAFRHLKARRILMVSTWPQDKSFPMDNWKAYLSEGGVEISGVKHIRHGGLSIHKGLITHSMIYEQMKAGIKEYPDVDAVYLQSGTLSALGSVEAWEKEIRKPIVSLNSADIWNSFRPFNISPVPGYGQLLASLG